MRPLWRPADAVLCAVFQDFFFYSLVYDPQQKTLLADKGEIRVGNRYQADITDLLKEGRALGRQKGVRAPAAFTLRDSWSFVSKKLGWMNWLTLPLPVGSALRDSVRPAATRGAVHPVSAGGLASG